MNSPRDGLEMLELRIDLRLRELWQELDESGADDDTKGMVASYMRAAYGKGYQDCLTEPVLGELFIENGYKVPQRRSA